ncbi:MAG: hypothetical protein HFE73_04345 [Firmicutes bacterium]|nr:hypothetical protein [Bacillota bacterium]
MVKILIGLAIIGWSFYYILKNKGTMLENLLKKSAEDYEKKQALQEKAYQVVDGQADAFDTIVDGAREAIRPAKGDVTKMPASDQE